MESMAHQVPDCVPTSLLPQWKSRFEKAFGFFGVRSSFAA